MERPNIVPALPQIKTFTVEVTNDLLRKIKLPPSMTPDSSLNDSSDGNFIPIPKKPP